MRNFSLFDVEKLHLPLIMVLEEKEKAFGSFKWRHWKCFWLFMLFVLSCKLKHKDLGNFCMANNDNINVITNLPSFINWYKFHVRVNMNDIFTYLIS
jgi:hypothetical protein